MFSLGKKVKTVYNAFIEILNESNGKPNNLWFDQERKFYKKFMQEWLSNNDILIYSTYNEGKSVITERFIKTSKAKIHEKMTAKDSKSYLNYLINLEHQYRNTYHHSINKRPINADYSALTEKIKTNPKVRQLKINDRVRITKYKNILVTVTLKIGQ